MTSRRTQFYIRNLSGGIFLWQELLWHPQSNYSVVQKKTLRIPAMSVCIHARVICITALLLCRVSNQDIKTGKHGCGQASGCSWRNVIRNLRGVGAGWRGGKGKLGVWASTCLNVKGQAEIGFKLPAFVKFLPSFKLSLLVCYYQKILDHLPQLSLFGT
jgi:hypothetical protein